MAPHPLFPAKGMLVPEAANGLALKKQVLCLSRPALSNARHLKVKSLFYVHQLDTSFSVIPSSS